MLNPRERAIKNVLLTTLGGPASYVEPRRQSGEVDPTYLLMESRRMLVNKRRAIIFAVLYLALTVTAAYVVTVQTNSYNPVLWCVVATFNAVSGAIQYAKFRERRMACDVLELLREDEDTDEE